MFMMISFRGLLLLLLSREFFIFQIADVHLLHSATLWRLLGQKYLLTAEVMRLRLRGERLAVWCGNEIELVTGVLPKYRSATGPRSQRHESGPTYSILAQFSASNALRTGPVRAPF